MSTHDPIAAAKRTAKAMSRTDGITHQQALDAIARDRGHDHWNAYRTSLSAHGTSTDQAVRDTPRAAKDAEAMGWRRMHLERLKGARHSPVDMWLTRWLGGAGGRLSRFAGLPATSGMLLIAGLLVTAYGMLRHIEAKDMAVTSIIWFALCLMFGQGTLNNPDHPGARRLRGAILSFCIVWTAVLLTMDVAVMIEGARYREPLPGRVEMMTPPLIVGLSLLTMMHGIAWRGGDLRRRLHPSRSTGAPSRKGADT